MVTAMAILVTGCGGGDGSGGATSVVSIEPAQTPDTRDCAAEALATDVEPDGLTPAPGEYLYATTGERGIPEDRATIQSLPKESVFTATAANDFENVECFVLQRKLSESLADTSTIAIRGSDAYLTKIVAQAGGQITELAPNPPVLIFSGDELEWEGTFEGPTSGRYRSSIIGRKSIKVGNKRFSAVGVRTEIALSGEIEGTESVTRWLSARENLVLAETVDQRRKFGVDTVVLRYKAKLKKIP